MSDLAVRASHEAWMRVRRRRAAGGAVRGYDAGGAPDQDFTPREDLGELQHTPEGLPYYQAPPQETTPAPTPVGWKSPLAGEPIPELEVLRQQGQQFRPLNPMQPGGGRTWASPDVVPPVGPPRGGGEPVPSERVSPRMPTAARSTEDPLGDERLQIDLQSLKNTPTVYNRGADLIRQYPNLRPEETKGSAHEVTEALINHAVGNILWLHDQVQPDVSARSRLWYDGGRKIAEQFAQQYGTDVKSSAAAIATQSPQRDWYRNVDLARRIHDITQNKALEPWSPEMTAEAAQPYYAKTKIAPLVQAIQGKSYSELDDPTLKALWVRMYDSAHNSPDYHLITPEGEFGERVTNLDGTPAQRTWSGSLDEISRGIQSLEAKGDLTKISPLLGDAHKVRSFYNNLVDPNSPHGDVTIDTHAVSAALLRPLSSTDEEVDHNFGKSSAAGRVNPGGSDVTGVRGLYPLYAEAYRRAAAARGLLPREMQSITWEAARGLFSPAFKRTENGAVDQVWRGYQQGQYSLDDARSKILELAGGIEKPSWYRPASAPGDNAAARDSGDARQLPGAVVPGGGAGPVDLGARAGAAEGAAGGPGAVGGGGLAEAQAAAARSSLGRPPVRGLPQGPFSLEGKPYIAGPNAKLQDIASDYMRSAGLDPETLPKAFRKVDKTTAARIADAYDAMKHDPTDPRVAAAYDAMINETIAQYQAIKAAGIKFEWIKDKDPYEESPRLAAKDVAENNHLWVFPTALGHGTNSQEDLKNNPLLRPTGIVEDGHPMLANDVFRIVHDVFGHLKDGNGFRAEGEEHAWRSHSAMYSPLARGAMTSETRGQNSWLNYGPYGDKNRSAKSADTTYADQKVGLLPQWVIDEGRADPVPFSPWQEPLKRALGGRVVTGKIKRDAFGYVEPVYGEQRCHTCDHRGKPGECLLFEKLNAAFPTLFALDSKVDPHGYCKAYATRKPAEPTKGQAEAGNYQKAHITMHGLPISIENMRGTKRKGIGRNGKPWEVSMPAHYGYIKRTEGADGDHVDAYIGKHPGSERVFVVNQHDADTKRFDEHKVMLGYASKEQAVSDYDKGFSDGRGPDRRHSIVEMGLDDFKQRLKTRGGFTKAIKRAAGGSVRGYDQGGAPEPEEFTDVTGAEPEEFSAADVRGAETPHSRYRSAVQSLASGSPEAPAGGTAPTYPKPQPFAETLQQYGQVGKGLAKGIPATLSGGIGGDIESTARTLLRGTGVPVVSDKTWLPTTEEGGYLGPKGAGVMNPAANPEEAAGMAISSALIPGIKKVPGALRDFRGPRVPPSAADMAPFEMHPNAPTPIVRGDSGARLLPADVPHALPDNVPTTIPKQPGTPPGGGAGPGRAGVGAQASRGPLAEISPQTIEHLRNVLGEEQFTPYSLEQRLEEMSEHQFLGEVTPNMESRMGGLASFPGQSRTEIVNSLRARQAETQQRLRQLFDNAMGPAADLSQERRLLNIQQQQMAGPLYQQFRQTSIPMTPEMADLVPRLRAAGAMGQARRLAGVQGVPWYDTFDAASGQVAPFGNPGLINRSIFDQARGPLRTVQSPTAQSWDLIKQGLDAKIEASFNQFGEPTKWTRAYTQLKNDLIGAIDNHPDPQIGQLWRQARDAFAGPAQIKSAQQMGKRLLSESIDRNELPFMTSGYSPAQMQGVVQGMRSQLENLMGRAGPQERRTINQILSPNNQQKIRWMIGDDQADQLFAGVQHEANMWDAPTRLVGNSPTAARLAAQQAYKAKPPLFSPENAMKVAGAAIHPIRSAGEFMLNNAGERLNAVREAQAARLREEVARVMTLQGPERDAVLRWLTYPQASVP